MPSLLANSRHRAARPAGPLIHLAILHARYIDAILLGDKTIESRLSRTRRAPFGIVHKGDIIFFKESGGPVRARARVKRALFLDDLDEAQVARVRDRYNADIGGDDAYWQSKRDARFASLIWLVSAAPLAAADSINVPASNGHAWFVGV